MKYRTGIAGLRIIAVALALVLHAGLGLLGGFYKVGVVLVISGYLISIHLWAAMKAGIHRILTLYRRGVRRMVSVVFVALGLVRLVATAKRANDHNVTYRSIFAEICRDWFCLLSDGMSPRDGLSPAGWERLTVPLRAPLFSSAQSVTG